jgi:hypothetical protein
MKKPLLALAALLALASLQAAHSQPESAYYGLSLGELDYTDEGFTDGLFSDSVSTWHLMVGYQFMEHLAVEGAYGKSGTISDTRSLQVFSPQFEDVEFVTELERILTIRLLGVLPFDNGLSLMAGIGYADTKQDVLLNASGAPLAGGEVSDNHPAYYFGVQYDWDRIALRLGYQKFDMDFADAKETSLTFFYKL